MSRRITRTADCMWGIESKHGEREKLHQRCQKGGTFDIGVLWLSDIQFLWINIKYVAFIFFVMILDV